MTAISRHPGLLEDDARRMCEAAERCGRIVRTFLNMARQKPPARNPVLLNDIVSTAADIPGFTLLFPAVALARFQWEE